MYRILAAELTSWSMARSAKFQVMNSITGRSPTIAAPTPTPANPSSVIGVSTTRMGPNSSSRPRLTLYAPWYTPTSSPMRKTSGSRCISSRRAWFRASRYVRVGM